MFCLRIAAPFGERDQLHAARHGHDRADLIGQGPEITVSFLKVYKNKSRLTAMTTIPEISP